MSAIGKADHHKPSRGRRNDSGELDVFEAARYFSGYNDGYALGGGASYLMAREEKQGHFKAGRTSLDLPSLKHHHHHQYNHHQNHQKRHQQIRDKKYKQPSSPGGKLAHFLNSLFTQAITSKKKPSKSKKKDDEDDHDHDDSPSSGRRRRKSSCSITHFRATTSSSVDTKSLYSCSSFGFRSPPSLPAPYHLNTPTKSFRNNSFSDHHHHHHPKKRDDEQIANGSRLDPRVKNGGKAGDSKKETLKKLIKEEELDDGAESDSSSDLFELQIDYGFGFCSTGLPVYETTCMETINRPSVNNGPIQT